MNEKENNQLIQLIPPTYEEAIKEYSWLKYFELNPHQYHNQTTNEKIASFLKSAKIFISLVSLIDIEDIEESLARGIKIRMED